MEIRRKIEMSLGEISEAGGQGDEGKCERILKEMRQGERRQGVERKDKEVSSHAEGGGEKVEKERSQKSKRKKEGRGDRGRSTTQIESGNVARIGK
ncbi:hypothetical protein PBY51_015624 [Eleginops maclovinus]|uniref:Uncharacterized protein n=1 Tax=Eleginops maclovinus TaxID=56733 RepID=A0AAN7XJ74_ELEMC|nr:hypothetical protein PBY51_015624 [Eleginops maclovinus]